MIFCRLLFMLIIICNSYLYSQTPMLINYQGKITGYSNATLSMNFFIYDQGKGGVNLWSQTMDSVEVRKGVFNVFLGGNLYPFDQNDLDLYDGERWLEIQISGESPFRPRLRLVSVPSAVHSFETNMADSVRFLADSSVDTDKINPTGASDGDVLTYDGADVMWKSPFDTTFVDSMYIEENELNSINKDMIAIDAVGSSEILDESIKGSDIKNGSISSIDILNESGVRHFSTQTANSLTTTPENILSGSINIPTSGYVYVTASVQFYFFTITAEHGVDVSISQTSNTHNSLNMREVYIPSAVGLGEYMFEITVMDVFSFNQSGNKTFYLVASEDNASGRISRADLILLYIPSSY